MLSALVKRMADLDWGNEEEIFPNDKFNTLVSAEFCATSTGDTSVENKAQINTMPQNALIL